ncbi:ribosomal L1 domain-containing 1-like, partial [Brachionus plicatilis]
HATCKNSFFKKRNLKMEKAIEEFQSYLKNSAKNELFAEAKKISLQVCLHKIPNLLNDKLILCKLPNPLFTEDTSPEVCLIVKDIDKKDRDYEKTIRKYEKIIKDNQLDSIIKKVLPLKQLNLEFRPFETKRTLSTSFDIFLADKRLHEILFNGSKLGKEFHKRKRMPFGVDVEGSKNLKEDVMKILNSTTIRLTGKGPVLDVNTFLSTHSVQQAVENVNAVKAELIKNLPGGESNIKSMFIKSTDAPAIPIYIDLKNTINDIKVPNNMTPAKIKKSKKLVVKRLNKQKQIKNKENSEQKNLIKKKITKK